MPPNLPWCIKMKTQKKAMQILKGKFAWGNTGLFPPGGTSSLSAYQVYVIILSTKINKLFQRRDSWGRHLKEPKPSIWTPSVPTEGFPCSSVGKESACNAGDRSSVPGSGRSLEKEMAAHSSILAWEIPRREEPGGLQSLGSPLGSQESVKA